MRETMVLDDGFPREDAAEDPALDGAISGIGVSAQTGGMAQTGADEGKPDDDKVGVDVDAEVEEEEEEEVATA